MARSLRIEYEGACYHVMNRGSRGQEVDRTRDDYGLFIEKLAQFSENSVERPEDLRSQTLPSDWDPSPCADSHTHDTS